jgi:hypothetical protein
MRRADFNSLGNSRWGRPEGDLEPQFIAGTISKMFAKQLICSKFKSQTGDEIFA